jgi:hypothetical protein
MQTENTQSDLFKDEFHLDDTGKMHIASLASWAMVVVVTSVLGYIVNTFELFISKDEYEQVEGFSSAFSYGSSTGGSIFSIIIGLLINFFLYRFASQAKTAVGALNPEKLNNSFRNLKIYFVITSILMILVLLLVLLGMTALLR